MCVGYGSFVVTGYFVVAGFCGREASGALVEFQACHQLLSLYYVESGAARVCVDDVWYELRSGQLFLIPKYACHSYECTGG